MISHYFYHVVFESHVRIEEGGEFYDRLCQ